MGGECAASRMREQGGRRRVNDRLADESALSRLPFGMSTYFYIDPDGQQAGPLESYEMIDLMQQGLLKPDTQVFREGDDQWRQLRHYPEIATALRSSARPRMVAPDARRHRMESSSSENPPNFGLMVVLALLLWPGGMIASIVYLCDPRYRSAGVALFLISLASLFVSWFVVRACRG
jgi:hypothetical protein